MDADGVDDIVTLDGAGDIHIFYGGGTPIAPVFTKKYIDSGYGLSLGESQVSHGGAVYFDGMVQPRNTQKVSNTSEPMNEDIINRLLFVGLPYVPGASNVELGNADTYDFDAASLTADGASALGDFTTNFSDFIITPNNDGSKL